MSEEVDSSAPAPEAAIVRARAALEGNGITAFIVDTSEQAKDRALALIPDGATVAHGSSVTLVATEVRSALHPREAAQRVQSGDRSAVKPERALMAPAPALW